MRDELQRNDDGYPHLRHHHPALLPAAVRPPHPAIEPMPPPWATPAPSVERLVLRLQGHHPRSCSPSRRNTCSPGVINLGHANHPAVLSVFDQIMDLIHSRDLRPVTLDRCSPPTAAPARLDQPPLCRCPQTRERTLWRHRVGRLALRRERRAEVGPAAGPPILEEGHRSRCSTKSLLPEHRCGISRSGVSRLSVAARVPRVVEGQAAVRSTVSPTVLSTRPIGWRRRRPTNRSSDVRE